MKDLFKVIFKCLIEISVWLITPIVAFTLAILGVLGLFEKQVQVIDAFLGSFLIVTSIYWVMGVIEWLKGRGIKKA